MNKNIGIGIIVVILVVLGVWYFSSDMGASTGENNATSTATTTGTGTGSTGTATGSTGSNTASSNTFRSIFTQTGNYECKYSQVTASGQSTSVIYLADGKMRGEFRTVSGDTNTANLMIYSGGTLYSWQEGKTTGKRSSIKTIADLPEAIPNDLTSGASFGVNSNSVGWDCHNWAKDSKVFTVPTYVTFSS